MFADSLVNTGNDCVLIYTCTAHNISNVTSSSTSTSTLNCVESTNVTINPSHNISYGLDCISIISSATGISNFSGPVSMEMDEMCCLCTMAKREDMVACDSCNKWFHYSCVNLLSAPVGLKWFCPECRKLIVRVKRVMKKNIIRDIVCPHITKFTYLIYAFS